MIFVLYLRRSRIRVRTNTSSVINNILSQHKIRDSGIFMFSPSTT